MSERNNIAFEIVKHFGTIARHEDGWDRELNLVRWNGGAPKYDIREWDEHHERMGRGITLHEGEMRRVVELFLESKNREAVSRGRQLQEEKYRRRQVQFEQTEPAEPLRDDFPATERKEPEENAMAADSQLVGGLEPVNDEPTAGGVQQNADEVVHAGDALIGEDANLF